MNVTRALAIVISVTSALVGAGPVAAKDAAVASQPRVRVLAPSVSDKPIVGQLVGSDEATLTVRRSRRGGSWWLVWPFGRSREETLTLPRESVTRFERSVRPSRKHLGALIGGLVSLGIGIGIAQAQCDDPCNPGQLAFTALPGALLGSAVAPGERWAAEDARKMRIEIAPVAPGRGVGVRLSLAF